MSLGHLDLEGLFLVNGNAERVDWLRQRYDSGEEVKLEKEADLASAVSLLRLFLQELPEPVIPTAIQGRILQLYQGVWPWLCFLFSCHFMNFFFTHPQSVFIQYNAVNLLFHPVLLKSSLELWVCSAQSVNVLPMKRVLTIAVLKTCTSTHSSASFLGLHPSWFCFKLLRLCPCRLMLVI